MTEQDIFNWLKKRTPSESTLFLSSLKLKRVGFDEEEINGILRQIEGKFVTISKCRQPHGYSFQSYRAVRGGSVPAGMEFHLDYWDNVGNISALEWTIFLKKRRDVRSYVNYVQDLVKFLMDSNQLERPRDENSRKFRDRVMQLYEGALTTRNRENAPNYLESMKKSHADPVRTIISENYPRDLSLEDVLYFCDQEGREDLFSESMLSSHILKGPELLKYGDKLTEIISKSENEKEIASTYVYFLRAMDRQDSDSEELQFVNERKSKIASQLRGIGSEAGLETLVGQITPKFFLDKISDLQKELGEDFTQSCAVNIAVKYLENSFDPNKKSDYELIRPIIEIIKKGGNLEPIQNSLKNRVEEDSRYRLHFYSENKFEFYEELLNSCEIKIPEIFFRKYLKAVEEKYWGSYERASLEQCSQIAKRIVDISKENCYESVIFIGEGFFKKLKTRDAFL